MKTPEDFEIIKKYYIVQMADGSKWAVPVADIAMNRAEHYMRKYSFDLIQSLVDDTLPLFQEDIDEITYWARNNMNWSEISNLATQVEPPRTTNTYKDDWVNPQDWEIK